MSQQVRNYYINTILRSKMLLDEDMDRILSNCEVCCENRTECSWFEKCKRLTVLCLWGISVYKYRLFGFIVTTPLAVFSAKALYGDYKVERYKNNVEALIEAFTRLHKINRDITKYLKVRELFNKSFSHNVSEHIKTIFNKEITLIEDLMGTTERLCEFSEAIEPEGWEVADLHLNIYNNQEECYENFMKLHDVFILTVSQFLAAVAITVPLNQHAVILDKIVPNALKIIKNHVNSINSAFTSARSLTAIQKPLISAEAGDRAKKPAVRLEQSLSQLLTHLQLTFESAHQIYGKFDQKINIEDLAEEVLALQEQFTLCEQTLDQFCGIYGILVKKSVIKANRTETERVTEKIADKSNNAVVTVKDDGNEEDLEAGDEEYEMYVGESSDEGGEVDGKGDFCEETQSSACLLLVLQELKDRLKERQIMRAKKLGLPPPEVDATVRETKVIPPPKPPILVSCSDPQPEFTAQIGTSSFANAIKLMAQQRHCEEDIFEDETE